MGRECSLKSGGNKRRQQQKFKTVKDGIEVELAYIKSLRDEKAKRLKRYEKINKKIKCKSHGMKGG